MSEHHMLGKKGEGLAKRYLLANGYFIRDTNWRDQKHEIDIVAEKDGLLVIVEVKTRTSEDFEPPKEAVTKKKQKSIIKATDSYIRNFDIKNEVRFDIIGITFIQNKFEIEHIEDAFHPILL